MTPLKRDQLPPVPEGTVIDGANPDHWALYETSTDSLFSPKHLPALRELVAWLETANGLAPQAERERGELAAYREYFEAVEHSRECAGMHCYEMVHYGKVRDETAKASDAANERIRAAKERIASLPAASSAEELQRRALRGVVTNAGRLTRVPRYRWAHVIEATGLGSTSAKELCREQGFDPDEQVPAKEILDDEDDTEDIDDIFDTRTTERKREDETDVAPPATTARGLPTDLEKIEFAIAALSPFEEATHGFEWQVDEGNYPVFFKLGILRDARDARDKLIALRDAYKKDAHA